MKIPDSAAFTRAAGGVVITLSVQRAGRDLLLLLAGGDEPHIGSVVAASPRASRTGIGLSATSSVINRPGHCDEIPARRLAERLAASLNTHVVCACGIHVDQAGEDTIRKILACCESLAQEAEHALMHHD